MIKKITAIILAAAMSVLTIGSALAAPSPTPSAEPTAAPKAQNTETELSNEYKSFRQIAQYVAERYIDASLDENDIIQMGLSNYLDGDDATLVQMLKAMLQSLDNYSDFYTAAEYTKFESDVNKTFYGIGINMQQSGNYVEIAGFVEENGKAQESGFMVGDKIVKIDGADVVGWSITDIRSKIIGEVNTTVNITVLRGDEYVDLVGIRTEVRQNTVNSTILTGNIGYVKVSSFGTNTANEFDEVMEEYSQREITNVILDLRNNLGGKVDSAVAIAKMIIPAGKIIDVQFRQSEYNITYTSELENPTKKFVVLVNQNTASSAEILSSAIQDSGVGILLGTQTYGKAVVQNSYPLNNGSVFKLTVGQYITRNGNEINEIGLKPDIDVTNQTTKIDSTQYTKFDFQSKWALGDTGSPVRAAKERLSMLGYYTGKTDDETFYSDLRSAIKQFQLNKGLAAYGVLDIPTQVKLENEFEKLEIATDNQLEEAYKHFGGDINNLYN